MAHRTCPVALPAGRTLHLHADTGARLICTSGRVSVRTAPQWLGQQMLTQRLTLHEGEAMPIEAGGWICVDALRQAEFTLLAPPPGVLHAALAAFLRLRGRWRRVPPRQTA